MRTKLKLVPLPRPCLVTASGIPRPKLHADSEQMGATLWSHNAIGVPRRQGPCLQTALVQSCPVAIGRDQEETRRFKACAKQLH